jgi:uncharacterized repeat protein (TIGR03803 family)
LTGLCDCGAASGVQQSVATVPGTTYKLSFFVGNTYIPGAGTTATVNAYVNSNLLLTAENTEGQGKSKQIWQQFSATFVASGSTTTIAFFNGTSAGYVNCGLDSVSLVATSTSTFSTLYSFTGAADGSTPNGALIFNSGGQLYGTTIGGGTDRDGTIFRFDPTNKLLTTLYSFTGQNDGAQPVPKLALDSNGTIYGAAHYGGSANAGTVYRFVPNASQFTSIYSFQGLADGASPNGGLLIDRSGNVDGTAAQGGAFNFGSVFQVNPNTSQETNLYSFNGASQGNHPNGIPTLTNVGLIFGATSKGGTNGSGLIFSVNPSKKTEKVLYRFTGGNDGDQPNGGLVFNSAGMIFGTTHGGGTNDAGTIYQFNPVTLQFTTLYSFSGGDDGAAPGGAMVLDSSGNLYGITGGSTKYPGNGTVFEFAPATGDLVTLHQFSGGSDGSSPSNGLIFDPSGKLYGATQLGGTSGFGTLFSVTP